MNKMSFIKKNLANFITGIRIMLSFVLISLIPLSIPFMIVYTVCGLTDVIDGFIARKLNTESRFGSVLDSLSDLILYSVMIIEMWDILHKVLPLYIWIIFWAIIGLRLFLYIYVAYNFKEMLSNHTILNKATGFMIFMLPYAVMVNIGICYTLLLEVVAIAAVIYEFKLVGEKNETR